MERRNFLVSAPLGSATVGGQELSENAQHEIGEHVRSQNGEPLVDA